MSHRAWSFIWSVFVAGIVLSVVAWPGVGDQNSSTWFLFVLLTALATIVQLYEAQGPGRELYYPHFTLFFAGVFLLHPFLFVLLVTIPHLIEWAEKRISHSPNLRDWYIQPFNIANHIIAGSVARALYIMVEANTPLFFSPSRVFFVILIAFFYVLINHSLIGLVLVFARNISLRTSKLLTLENLLPDLILAGLGYVVAVLWILDPWAIVPALSPLVLMYQALKIPQLMQEAQTDAKTGLLNARHFNKVFTTELDRAKRFNRPLALIMADLDLMRNINNTYGHLAGDAVLAGIGKIINETIREYDSAGRFGGEEFAIVLPEVTQPEAYAIAERLRTEIAAARFTGPGSSALIQATMSMGVACFPHDASTPINLTHSADVAVYQAKREGRNKVVCASEVEAALFNYQSEEPCISLPDLNEPEANNSPAAEATPEVLVEDPAPIVAPPVNPSSSSPSEDRFQLLVQDAFDKIEAQLQHRAFYDNLTDLPNRDLFLDRLEHALARKERQRQNVAVLFLDLDHFKVINDSLGHDVGDMLLIAMARRLKNCVRQEDTISRLGGDEFTILLEAVVDINEPARVAERIITSLQAPFLLNGQEIYISTSIGIVLPDQAYRRPTDILRDGDLALYRAKRKGKACYEMFDPSMNARALERLELERELRRALEHDEFEVYYQPKVKLATGQLEGMEALVRWRHPVRGMVSPAEFIPIAEETGLIRQLGRWVLEEACRQTRAWTLAHPNLPPLVMSVNLSARQFQHNDLVETIAQVLRDTGVEPRYIQLEITETLLMEEAEATIITLRRLKEMGLQLAIDDFGTGFSSLSYLRRFPVDTLKLDRSFIAGLIENAENRAIVQAVLTLGRALNLSVIAEGVESLEESNLLNGLGCELGQGYYFARPLPSKEAEKFLKKNTLPISSERDLALVGIY